MAKVKVNGSKPSNPAAAVGYADIKGQGRIPYGSSDPAPVAGGIATYGVDTNTKKPHKMTVRGAGAAIRGTSYLGYSS